MKLTEKEIELINFMDKYIFIKNHFLVQLVSCDREISIGAWLKDTSTRTLYSAQGA